MEHEMTGTQEMKYIAWKDGEREKLKSAIGPRDW